MVWIIIGIVAIVILYLLFGRGNHLLEQENRLISFCIQGDIDNANLQAQQMSQISLQALYKETSVFSNSKRLANLDDDTKSLLSTICLMHLPMP